MLLVNVLLKDVPKNVRIDLAFVAQRSVIEPPVPRIEKYKDAFEGLVRNLNKVAAARI